MAWGDDDVVVRPARGAPAARPAASFGQDDVVVKPSGGAKAAPKGKPKTSQALGLYKGVTTPLDNAAEWLEGGVRKVAPGAVDAINRFGESVGLAPSATAAREQHTAGIERAKAAGYKPGMAGQIGGSILAGLPLLAVTKNPALLGAASGALETEKGDNIVQNAIAGAALGHYGGKVMSRAGQIIAPKIDPAVRYLADRGVKLTPGQIYGGKVAAKEGKRTSRPIVGDMIRARTDLGLDQFNRGATNEAVLPLGKSLPDDVATGHDAIGWAQKQVSDAYDEIMPQVTLKPDSRLMVGVRQAWEGISDREAQEKFLDVMRHKLDFSSPRVSRYGPVKTKQVMKGHRPYQDFSMSPQRTAVALRDIRDTANAYLTSGTESERAAGRALKNVHDTLLGTLERQNPHVAKQLKAANRAYQGVQILNKSGAHADEGVFGTAKFRNEVTNADKSKNRKVAAAGKAVLQDYSRAARKVLPTKDPNTSRSAAHLNEGSLVQQIMGAGSAAKFKARDAMAQMGLRTSRAPGAQIAGGLLTDLSPFAGTSLQQMLLHGDPNIDTEYVDPDAY